MRKRPDEPDFYAPERRMTRWLVMIIIILAGALGGLVLYRFVLHP
jgi:hypothetical protein